MRVKYIGSLLNGYSGLYRVLILKTTMVYRRSFGRGSFCAFLCQDWGWKPSTSNCMYVCVNRHIRTSFGCVYLLYMYIHLCIHACTHIYVRLSVAALGMPFTDSTTARWFRVIGPRRGPRSWPLLPLQHIEAVYKRVVQKCVASIPLPQGS